MTAKSVKSEILQETEPLFTGEILTKKVSLTAAQIRSLSTTVGIELVATPGSGYAIELISGSVRYTYAGTVFAQAVTPSIKTDTGTLAQMNAAYLDLTLASTQFQMLLYSANSTTAQLVDNKALKVYSQYAASATGNGTMDIYILYRIITL